MAATVTLVLLIVVNGSIIWVMGMNPVSWIIMAVATLVIPWISGKLF